MHYFRMMYSVILASNAICFKLCKNLLCVLKNVSGSPSSLRAVENDATYISPTHIAL